MPRALARASILLGALLLAGGGVASAGPEAPPPDETTPPNVLVVMLDDGTELMVNWRRPDGSFVMPTVQALKAESTTYPNTFVDIPSCCPSRFSTFTGRYPHNTGGKQQVDGLDLPVDETFAYALDEAGYATAMSGKFLVPWRLRDAPPSYDRWSTVKGNYYGMDVNRDGVVGWDPGYTSTVLADDLRGFLTDFEAQDAMPWYAYLSTQTPHASGGWKGLAVPEHRDADADVGICAQPVETDRSDKPPYVRYVAIDEEYTQALCESQLRALLSVDRRLAEILDQLRADGEYDDTMIVITSDNGLHWGEQGWFSKFYPYEASINIPMIVKWPASLGIAPGVDDRLASSLDLTATIHSVTGVPPTTELDGDDLLQPATRDEVLVEYFRDKDNGEGIATWALLRGRDYKYVENTIKKDGSTTTFKEYYDLAADPGESTNVLHDDVEGNEPPAKVLKKLAKRLHAAKRCAGDACP